jgi:hypothetical protein
LQAAAAGGLRAAPPEAPNTNNYDKKQKLAIKKTQKYDEKRREYLKTQKKKIMPTKIENINRLMNGVLLSVLLLQLFIVAVAPFAARVGYPLVVAVSSGVTTTIYPGPVLIVAAMVAGFAVTLATPRRYYGIFVVVIAIALVMLMAILGNMGVCYFCKEYICNPYPVVACGLHIGAWEATIICACYIP